MRQLDDGHRERERSTEAQYYFRFVCTWCASFISERCQIWYGCEMMYEAGCGLIETQHRQFIRFDRLRERKYSVMCVGRAEMDK